ncbi:MAG: YchF/TatD family DNA exonuclease [Candidatus Eisenbacteria bacterium]|nr:YchF/TatD family DNA exonuclease [Candidatus Eisenbacteria bacterium]
MIDTHAHLHTPDFAADRERVLTRSFAMGLAAILEVSIDSASWPAVTSLAASDPRLFGAVGIHPHEARPSALPALSELPRAAAHDDVVAIGETGMDRVRSRTRCEDQRLLFRAQVGMARELGLPLVIHCREAFGDLLPILDAEGRGQVRGVFHCFTGDARDAAAVIDRGFAIGLAGGVTYDPKRWRMILRDVPHEALLLETDAPFLKPAPQRRGRNEPAHVYETARVVARLIGVTVRELERITDRNAVRLFRLPLPGRDG